MPENHPPLRLDQSEISTALAIGDWASRFPLILNVDQAAELLHTKKQTIYAWSSQGRLEGCAFRAGKRLCLWRDRLIELATNGKL